VESRLICSPILQTQWLRSGDGRVKQAEAYTDEEYAKRNDEYDVSGNLWVPNGAQEYICIVELTDELLHGEAKLSEAM